MPEVKGKAAAADDLARLIDGLLAVPSPEATSKYYHDLAALGIGKGLLVRYIGERMGRGVFADRSFVEEELVLKEPKLVGAQHTRNKMDALNCSFCFRYIGSVELQIGRRLKLMAECESVAQGHGHESELPGHSEGDALMEKRRVPENLVEALLTGSLTLPYSELFPLPPVERCCGGCAEEFYCSAICAKAAWDDYHSLLCSGASSLCPNKKALARFQEHADATNDIFHVAAQVIAKTILRARRIKDEKQRITDEAALLEAWEPFAMGHKGLWWDVMALPEDVDVSADKEFRDSIRSLAADSLSYLQEALTTREFGPLFSLEVYGHIIGMFELNNLEIVVASPLEDYFIYIDELPQAEKEAAEKVSRPFLEALGEDYAAYCQGTGFFSLQSCMNHSCAPNAKAFKRDEDKDGQAVLLATRDINPGEEITISYIDEQLPYDERQAALADYGFKCQCRRCSEGPGSILESDEEQSDQD